jgi:sensor c-di-GMP phosphodiesterase-like protein
LIIPLRQHHNPIAEIDRALAREEFIPFFQPIVDITSGKLLGAEVLVRWRKPDGTIVPPGAFIAVVESNGQVIDLTRSLMRRVCKELGAAIGRRPHVYLAFNFAPRHFDDALVLNDLGEIFDNGPIKLSQLVLELTERNEIEDLTNAPRDRCPAGARMPGCDR